jgi:O-antigen/teichoic acid export membrane protein
LGRTAAQVILLTTAVVVPNILGATDYGRLASILAFVAILEITSTGGLQVVEIRHVAPALLRGNSLQAEIKASTVWWTKTFLALFATIGAVFALSSRGFTTAPAYLWIAFGCYALSRSLTESSRHLLLTARRTTNAAGIDIARSLIVVAAALFYLLGGLTAVFAVMALAQVMVAAFALHAQKRVVNTPLRQFDWHFLSSNARLACVAWIGVVAWIAQSQLAVVALGASGRFAEAAVLGVGVQAFTAVQTMVIAARSAGLPEISHRFDEGHHDVISQWIGKFAWLAVSMTGLVSVIWALTGRLAVTVLPPSMDNAYRVIGLMLVATVPLAVALVIDGALFAIGAAGLATTGRVLFGLLTVVPLIVGESHIGVIGASYIYLMASVLFAVISLVAIRRVGLRLQHFGHVLISALPAFTVPIVLGFGGNTHVLAGVLVAYLLILGFMARVVRLATPVAE